MSCSSRTLQKKLQEQLELDLVTPHTTQILKPTGYHVLH